MSPQADHRTGQNRGVMTECKKAQGCRAVQGPGGCWPQLQCYPELSSRQTLDLCPPFLFPQESPVEVPLPPGGLS